MKYLVIATMLLFASCSPERRLAKLLKKHPELVTTDSTQIDTLLDIPAIEDSFSIIVPPDFAAVDSLTNSYIGYVDVNSLDGLNSGFRGILSRAINFDTTIINKGHKTHISGHNGKIIVEDEIKPDSLRFKAKVPHMTVQAPRDLTWMEWIYVKLGEKIGLTGMAFYFLLWIILIIFLLRWLWKKIFK